MTTLCFERFAELLFQPDGLLGEHAFQCRGRGLSSALALDNELVRYGWRWPGATPLIHAWELLPRMGWLVAWRKQAALDLVEKQVFDGAVLIHNLRSCVVLVCLRDFSRVCTVTVKVLLHKPAQQCFDCILICCCSRDGNGFGSVHIHPLCLSPGLP